MNFRFSFIIPAYNAEKYIVRCLESVAHIKSEEIEVIIIDDGSTDKTAYLCNKYVEKDKRFRYYYKKNTGVSESRNYGLSYATGKYIFFIDSDDEINLCDEDLERIWNIEFDCVIFGFERITKVTNKIIKPSVVGIKSLDFSLFDELFQMELLNSPCNKIYKKDFISICFDSTVHMGEDLMFNLNYLSKCKNVFLSDMVYYKYYENSGSAIGNIQKYDAAAACKLVNTYADLLNKRFHLEREEKQNAVSKFCNNELSKQLFNVLIYSHKKQQRELLNVWRKQLMEDTIVMIALETEWPSKAFIDTDLFMQFLNRKFVYRRVKHKIKLYLLKVKNNDK